MNQNEFKAFSDTLTAAWSFHKPIGPQQVSMAFELLKGYPLAIVIEGIKAHCIDPVRGQFPPKPADIVAQMEKWKPQRISADEAWTMVPRDESDTVVWTDEMAEAHAIAAKEHDRVASRMAFKSAYDRIVERNKAQNIFPKWVISEGWCADKRSKAVSDALRLGRLKEQDVDQRLLESPQGSIAGLLESHSTFDPDKAKENLCKLKNLLKGRDALADSIQSNLEDGSELESLAHFVEHGI